MVLAGGDGSALGRRKKEVYGLTFGEGGSLGNNASCFQTL
jgi:hypothetical protein